MSLSVTLYMPNTFVEVLAFASAVSSGAAAEFGLMIEESTSEVIRGSAYVDGSTEALTVSINYLTVNPTPGTTLDYIIKGADLFGTVAFPSGSSEACITVKMTTP